MDRTTARTDRLRQSASAREWRWGDGAPIEPGEDVVVTDAERRRLRRRYRLEHVVNVTMVWVAVVMLLAFCIMLGVSFYFWDGGPYCCGPE